MNQLAKNTEEKTHASESNELTINRPLKIALFIVLSIALSILLIIFVPFFKKQNEHVIAPGAGDSNPSAQVEPYNTQGDNQMTIEPLPQSIENEDVSTMYSLGEKTGEVFNKTGSGLKEFWEGFDSRTNVNKKLSDAKEYAQKNFNELKKDDEYTRW